MKNKKRKFAAVLTMSGTAATIAVSGTIGYDADAVDFMGKVKQAKEAGCTALTVQINSMGGYCKDGLAMADCLENCGMETTGYVVGTAQSMASFLLQCCQNRVAHKNASLMFHQPSAGVWGTVDEIAEQARYLCQLRDNMFAKMAARCGSTGPELSAEHQTMKMYTADEALAHGFLDSIDSAAVPTPAEDDDTKDADPAPQLKGCVMYGPDQNLAAMLGDDSPEEDDDKDDDTKDDKDDPDDDTKDEEPKDDDDADKPKDEEPKDDGKDGDKPKCDNSQAPAPLTRDDVAAMIAAERASILASIGAPAAGLPRSGGSPAPGSAHALTMEQIAKMPSMDRICYLDQHPELRDQYLRG